MPGWEDDCDGQFVKTAIRNPSLGDLECKLNGNDEIGFIGGPKPGGLDPKGLVFTKAENFGIGSYNIASTRNGDADTAGDFNLRFRIEQVRVINPPPANTPVTRG